MPTKCWKISELNRKTFRMASKSPGVTRQDFYLWSFIKKIVYSISVYFRVILEQTHVQTGIFRNLGERHSEGYYRWMFRIRITTFCASLVVKFSFIHKL